MRVVSTSMSLFVMMQYYIVYIKKMFSLPGPLSECQNVENYVGIIFHTILSTPFNPMYYFSISGKGYLRLLILLKGH